MQATGRDGHAARLRKGEEDLHVDELGLHAGPARRPPQDGIDTTFENTETQPIVLALP
ncbi:hypothetical protein GCM10009613_13820 [Pseudonocardia kongjuensis]|uniref:Uncharacterized protein n=1 Tax=Pseudonocardia kongjuensis TaxID=102227 RepID=A0ABP4IDS0_9PSEU